MGTDGKTDLRILKTHKQLWEAMVSLTVENGYSRITVNDICVRAMINRSTFYRHFEDKQDLLLRKTDEILFDMADRAKNPTEVIQDADYSEYTSFLQFIGDHAEFFKIMFAPDGMQLFTDRIYRYLYDVTDKRLRELPVNLASPPVPLDLLIHYLAGATMSLIRWWVENDLPCSSEELNIHNRRLFTQDPLSLLGISDEFVQLMRRI